MRDRNTDDVVIALEKKVEALGEEVRRLRAELSNLSARAEMPGPEAGGSHEDEGEQSEEPGQV